jgi:hypothetical protein
MINQESEELYGYQNGDDAIYINPQKATQDWINDKLNLTIVDSPSKFDN